FTTTYEIGIPTDQALTDVVINTTSHILNLLPKLDPRDSVEFSAWYGRTYFYPSGKVMNQFVPETAYLPDQLNELLKERIVRSLFINRADPTFPPFCQSLIEASTTDPYETSQHHILQLSLLDIQNPSLPTFTIKLLADPHFLAPPSPSVPYNAPFIPQPTRRSTAPKVKKKVVVESVLVPEGEVQVLGLTYGVKKTLVSDLVAGPDRWYHDIRVGVSVRRKVDIDLENLTWNDNTPPDETDQFLNDSPTTPPQNPAQIDLPSLKTYFHSLRILETINTTDTASKKKRKRA
ncbi:hypothetical protein HK097_006869, partial [Rhizophlyctis rosea]